jgi:hypothetical protein
VDIKLPQLHEELKGEWEEVARDTLGEFLIKVMLKEFLDKETSETAAAGWDGDAFTLIESKEEGGPMIVGWLSVWDSEKDASEFADAYAAALNKRFGKEPEKTQTGYHLEIDKEESALIEIAGDQVLVIQGAPESMIPEVKSAVLKARRVVATEQGFDRLLKQQPEKAPEKEEKETPVEQPVGK